MHAQDGKPPDRRAPSQGQTTDTDRPESGSGYQKLVTMADEITIHLSLTSSPSTPRVAISVPPAATAADLRKLEDDPRQGGRERGLRDEARGR
ncbi:hypothetical protein THAOC_37456, partial [Thalassiosira oceanica]